MKDKLRIVIAGLVHETNTFSPIWTEYTDFRILRGTDIFHVRFGQPRPSYQDVELLPTFFARAFPSGLIRKTAYQQLKQELLSEIKATLPVDGVYLDLHGAMEVEEIGDAEGDLVSTIRELVGNDALISVSLDLHGNISPTLVEQSNILTAFRTAPHRDQAETCQRGLRLLVDALRKQIRPVSALIKVPIVMSGEAAMTDREPAKALYARLSEIDSVPGIMNASLLIGCAWTDSAYTPCSVIVVTESSRELAYQHAVKLAREVWARRHDFHFGVETASIDESIQRAINDPRRPIFISDSGDNVTAGATGDIPLFIERLIALRAKDALVAGLADREAVQHCIAAGEGTEVKLSLGGKLDSIHGKPVVGTGRVLHLSKWEENRGENPTVALVEIEGIKVILAVDHRPFIDRATIAAAGIDPMQQKIVVVKQGYLSPDLVDHAPYSIMALSPGATDLQLDEQAYRHLPRPIFPFDKDFDWEPQ